MFEACRDSIFVGNVHMMLDSREGSWLWNMFLIAGLLLLLFCYCLMIYTAAFSYCRTPYRSLWSERMTKASKKKPVIYLSVSFSINLYVNTNFVRNFCVRCRHCYYYVKNKNSEYMKVRTEAKCMIYCKKKEGYFTLTPTTCNITNKHKDSGIWIRADIVVIFL